MNNEEVVLASASGVAVIERGPWLYVVDRRTGGLYTVVFVLCLMFPAFMIGGVVLGLAAGSELFVLAGVLVVFAAACALGIWRAIRTIRVRGARPLAQSTLLVSFDRQGGVLCNGAGQPVASLAGIALQRKMQITSSSPALHLFWGGAAAGEICLVKGNPFRGGVGPIEDALRHGLRLPG